MTQNENVIKAKKKFPWKTIFGAIFLLLFAGCSRASLGAFKNIGVVKPINEAFVERALIEGIPVLNDPVYSKHGGFTEAGVTSVNEFITRLGAPNKIGEMSCSGHSNVFIGKLSGEFVTCTGSLVYTISPGTLSTRWIKEGDDWKLFTFNINIENFDAYTDLVVEQKIEEKEQSDKPTDE